MTRIFKDEIYERIAEIEKLRQEQVRLGQELLRMGFDFGRNRNFINDFQGRLEKTKNDQSEMLKTAQKE